MTKSLIDQAVDRFLCWKLPEDFHPDAGITFTPHPLSHAFPIGTNLLTAIQAKAMLEHVAAPLIADHAELKEHADGLEKLIDHLMENSPEARKLIGEYAAKILFNKPKG